MKNAEAGLRQNDLFVNRTWRRVRPTALNPTPFLATGDLEVDILERGPRDLEAARRRLHASSAHPVRSCTSLRRVVRVDLERCHRRWRPDRVRRRRARYRSAAGTGSRSASCRGRRASTGVPSATISPLRDDRDPDQRGYCASSMKCVVRNTVLPSSVEVLDHLPRVATRARVEPGRRLVQEEQLGIPGQARSRHRAAAADRRRACRPACPASPRVPRRRSPRRCRAGSGSSRRTARRSRAP